ncbi:YihY/virulence factor BrkB family protein [Nocardioides sp.]|uniref:YihY/virulence factor BrkB family protein n=1 Tax=Nocardioides sp. TaxID=35761 RepID=UPI0035164937
MAADRPEWAALSTSLDRARALARSLLHTLWRLVVTTVGSCLRHRVTGLAAEGAFFAVLSIPPLIFALAGAVGYVSAQFSESQIDDVRAAVVELSGRFLTESAVDNVIVPTMNEVLAGGRFDVISVGFVLALWSGSRALNVFVDTITIMHGLGGHRGIVRTRALSFLLYVLAMLSGAVCIPLVVAGPGLVRQWLPHRADVLMGFYWPVVVAVCICFLATLYHVSVPVRTNWSFNLPGATFSLLAWILGSTVLRWFLTVTSTDSRSVYGPLAAPIAVLLWLYLLALAVLIGAAVNAACDEVLGQHATQQARRELWRRWRASVARQRDDERPPRPPTGT